MARLTEAERIRVIALLSAGHSQTRVAAVMNCTQRTISRLWNCYQQHGAVRDRPRSGRPKTTTPRQDNYIRVSHARDQFLPASGTARVTNGSGNHPISDRTVRRRLAETGLVARRPYVGPILTRRYR